MIMWLLGFLRAECEFQFIGNLELQELNALPGMIRDVVLVSKPERKFSLNRLENSHEWFAIPALLGS